jgi:uncharacterized damage-inducible protein DinB
MNAHYAWKSYFIIQMDYQLWANDRMFAALGHIDYASLAQDAGLPFHSIHHTVDHLLLVNRLWFGRLRGQNSYVDFTQMAYPDWNQLIEMIQANLRELQFWLEACDDAFFDSELAYTTSKGSSETMWVRDLLTHLMSHHVHHRGQISAVVTRLGRPALEMDYLYYKREIGAYRHQLAAIPATVA